MKVLISPVAEPGQEAVSIERVLDGRRDVRRIIDVSIEHPPTED